MNERLITIIFLGMTTLSSVLCATWLVATDHQIPDMLIAVAAGASGALGGVLAPRPSSDP